MKRLLKFTGLLLAIFGIGTALAGLWAAKATQEVPEFYSHAIEAASPNAAQSVQELEAQVQRLSRDVQRVGGWEATFTSDQINAWLAADLASEYPNLLPKGTTEPRVRIESGKVLVAAKYKNSKFNSVVSFELHARLTDEPNVVALKINRLRAGALPLPVGHFSKGISKAASRGDFEVRWEEEDGVPIALITIPSNHARYIEKPVMIERLELRDGEAYLAGRTGPHALTAWIPSGPIYQLAGSANRVMSQR